MDVIEPISIGEAPADGSAFVLSLDGERRRCTVQSGARFVIAAQGGEHIQGVMSGSPIISGNGEAIGVIPTGGSNINPTVMGAYRSG